MFQFTETPIDKVFEIKMPRFEDNRGSFIKVFEKSILLEKSIDFRLEESYFSISAKNVIRGMHFQTPPHQHHKIVFCPRGAVMDVVVDLRKSSPTFRNYFCTKLSAENHNGLFIPEGCAHGFKSLEDDSMTVYFVSSEYHKESDSGILWDSFGMEWECVHPIMSKRDQAFLSLKEFDSPF